MLKPLVTGGMAEVLLARAQGMGGFQHHVVIKAIRSNKSMEPSFIKSFVDEARLAASLHHHHIVQVHDVGHQGDDYFFAMEYVHGENLRRLLTKVARAHEVVPLDQVITIILAVSAGLHYAHQQNIVHRDVTPANILIGYDGNVKVTDFGIAKALLKSSELTKSGTMRGKVAYMAPEQCLGRPIDRRSDIFSLGIVLYELCTSRRLFKGDTDFLVMTSIVNGKIPKPTLHRKDLPLDLEDVILKALAPKPELRFATAEDLGMALEKIAANHGIRISSTALSDYMQKLFGTRPEPWLVDAKLETVDVDFDGAGTGLVEIDDEPSNAAVERELLESPILAAASAAALSPPDRNEFADDQRTEIEDHDDDEPPTLTGGVSRPTSGFEANEQTLLGDEADVNMLVNMSRIEGRRDATPVPRRDATPVPRRDATPVPRRDPTPTPTAPARRDATPTPTVPMRRDATPLPRDDTPLPAPRTYDTGQGAALPEARPQWATSPSGTGTPMAWAPQDGEVISLAPKGRRFMLIAAVSVPLVVLGVFVITRGSDDSGPSRSKSVEPDAFVETIDAAAASMTPDAALPDAATAAVTPDAGAQPAVPPNSAKKPPVAPVKKSPPTKKPPLKR